MADLHQTGALRVRDALGKRLDHAGTGAPRDVEAGDRVAVAGRGAVAALGPAHHGEELDAAASQPRALLAGRPLHVRASPLARPFVLGAVKTGRAKPVLQRKIQRILDAQPPLLGGIHEEQPAKRPPRLTANIVLVLLIHNDHALTSVNKFARSDQAGQTGTNNDGVCVSSGRFRRL